MVPAFGFDRWLVFLGKGGVRHGTLLAFAVVMACGAALSMAALVGCLHRESAILPASSSSAR